MAQSANGLDGNQIARLRAAMPQRVEGGDSGAHERRSLLRSEAVRHQGHGLGGRHHVLRIAAVMRETSDATILAVNEIPSPALRTHTVMTAIPAHAHSLALLPGSNIRAEFVDNAGD